MKIFAISGLGADERVFKYLNLNYEIIVINWITPFKKEKIGDYAKRLIKNTDISKNDCVLGVNFGGLVAVEISKFVKPKCTILISSVEIITDLRLIYRFFGKTEIMKLIPKRILNPPIIIANYIFGAKNKELLQQILNDTDLNFAKWTINELICWKNTQKIENCLKINENKDKLIPNKRNKTSFIIKNGEHFMIVDKSDKISRIINNWIKQQGFN